MNQNDHSKSNYDDESFEEIGYSDVESDNDTTTREDENGAKENELEQKESISKEQKKEGKDNAAGNGKVIVEFADGSKYLDPFVRSQEEKGLGKSSSKAFIGYSKRDDSSVSSSTSSFCHIKSVIKKSSSERSVGSSLISDADSSFVPVSRMKSLNVLSSSNSFASNGDPNTKSEWQLNPVTNDLKYRNTLGSKDADDQNDASSVASVQSVSTWATQCTTKSVASSTISGFDILSLNGNGSVMSCKKCTLLNPLDTHICTGCGIALVANPNLSMDAQIALNLHNKEQRKISTDKDELLAIKFALMENGETADLDNEMALWYEMNPDIAPERVNIAGDPSSHFGTPNISNKCTADNKKDDKKVADPEHFIHLLDHMKRKRKLYDCSSQSTYGTAQDLAQNIHQCVQDLSLHGIGTLPRDDLARQIYKFVKLWETNRATPKESINLGYTFSNKFCDQWQAIRNSGFGNNVEVSTDVEVAMKCSGRIRLRQSTCTVIVEDSDNEDGIDFGDIASAKTGDSATFVPVETKDACRLGWIVATCDKQFQLWSCTKKQVKVRNGHATVTKLFQSEQCLPLVCFDASMRKSDSLRLAMLALEDVICEFYEALSGTCSGSGESGPASGLACEKVADNAEKCVLSIGERFEESSIKKQKISQSTGDSPDTVQSASDKLTFLPPVNPCATCQKGTDVAQDGQMAQVQSDKQAQRTHNWQMREIQSILSGQGTRSQMRQGTGSGSSLPEQRTTP